MSRMRFSLIASLNDDDLARVFDKEHERENVVIFPLLSLAEVGLVEVCEGADPRVVRWLLSQGFAVEAVSREVYKRESVPGDKFLLIHFREKPVAYVAVYTRKGSRLLRAAGATGMLVMQPVKDGDTLPTFGMSFRRGYAFAPRG